MNDRKIITDIQETIKENGFGIVSTIHHKVTDSEIIPIPMAYTIGIEANRLYPDLIIFGVDLNLAAMIFHKYYSNIKIGFSPKIYKSNTIYRDIIQDVPLFFNPIKKNEIEKIAYANFEYHKSINMDPKMMQVIYPDLEGDFIGEKRGKVQDIRYLTLLNPIGEVSLPL